VWVADDEDVAFNDVQPLALPDEIDEDRLGRLLRKIEARADAGGWDGPLSTLHVYLVYDNTLVATDQTFRHMLADNPSIGPGLRLGGYTAQLMLPAAWIAGAPGPEYEALRRIALNLAYAPAGVRQGGMSLDDFRGTLRQSGVVALAACYEAWVRPQPGGLAQMRAEHGSNFADLPGSIEGRMVLAVDALDQTHTLRRLRGQPAQLEQGGVQRGDVSTSLRIMMDMIYSRSPRPSAFAEHYPSMLDAFARLDDLALRAEQIYAHTRGTRGQKGSGGSG
jgi:hypothetical protein